MCYKYSTLPRDAHTMGGGGQQLNDALDLAQRATRQRAHDRWKVVDGPTSSSVPLSTRHLSGIDFFRAQDVTLLKAVVSWSSCRVRPSEMFRRNYHEIAWHFHLIVGIWHAFGAIQRSVPCATLCVSGQAASAQAPPVPNPHATAQV
jgi:hypothetical protein